MKIIQIPALQLSSGPVTFLLDGIPVSVTEDTVTPANNVFLPVKDPAVLAQLQAITLDTLALSATTGQAGAPIANDGISVHGSDGTSNRKLLTDAAGRLQVDPSLPANAATETTLAAAAASLATIAAEDFATETTLAAAAASLATIAAEDFATETTLAAAAASLATIAAEDFATETTLAAAAASLATIAAEDFATETTLAAAAASLATIAAEDFATETTLAAAAASLATIAAEDFATETTLAAVNVNASRLGGSLLNVDHDEVEITYVGATDDIQTVIAKKATVTVATLTFSYDVNGRLDGVVRT
jgi:hypothetical protein